MGVLVLFAGLRLLNSIKNWSIRLSALYKVAVNIEDFDIFNGIEHFDILNGPEHDLVDDLVARKVLHMINEHMFHVTTLLDVQLPSLEISSRRHRQGQVCETACSLFTARCAQRASELGVSWLVELPAEHPGKYHMLQLDSHVAAGRVVAPPVGFDRPCLL